MLLAPCSHIKGLKFPWSSCTSPLPLTRCAGTQKTPLNYTVFSQPQAGALLINTTELKKTEKAFTTGLFLWHLHGQIHVLKALKGKLSPEWKVTALQTPRSMTGIPNTRNPRSTVLLEGCNKYRESFTANPNCTPELLSTPGEAVGAAEEMAWKWHPGSLCRDSLLPGPCGNQPHKDQKGGVGIDLHYNIWPFFFLFSLSGPPLYSHHVEW